MYIYVSWYAVQVTSGLLQLHKKYSNHMVPTLNIYRGICGFPVSHEGWNELGQ